MASNAIQNFNAIPHSTRVISYGPTCPVPRRKSKGGRLPLCGYGVNWTGEELSVAKCALPLLVIALLPLLLLHVVCFASPDAFDITLPRGWDLSGWLPGKKPTPR